MARKKLSKAQLKSCLERVTDSEKLIVKILNRCEERLDSKYQLTVVDVEQVFLKCSEDKYMLTCLHAEIQNLNVQTSSKTPKK